MFHRRKHEAFVLPSNYWEKDAVVNDRSTPEDIPQLEQERQQLLSAMPTMKRGERIKAGRRVDAIDIELRRLRGQAEDQRVGIERKVERERQQEQGGPASGNSTPTMADVMKMINDTTARVAALCADDPNGKTGTGGNSGRTSTGVSRKYATDPLKQRVEAAFNAGTQQEATQHLVVVKGLLGAK
jgi:hypothetical protein